MSGAAVAPVKMEAENAAKSRAKLNFARRNVEMTIRIGALCADKNGD
jgi:hypothetical protein